MVQAALERGRFGGSMRSKVVRLLKVVGVGLALAGVAVLAAARWFYPRILYPAPQRDLNVPGEGKLLEVTARDGVAVHALELLGSPSAPVLVYFHGNGVVMGDQLWMARELRARGLSVVMVEYRGYGLSAGTAPSETGLYDDAEAVLAELERRGVSRRRMVLFGESLGTGVAVEMATRGYGSSLVLVTPYTSIPEVAARFAPFLPVRLLMRERFDSLSKANQLALRTLILHGTRDEVVPYAMGERLSKALPNAQLVTVPGGHHNDLFLGEGFRLFDAVAKFVL